MPALHGLITGMALLLALRLPQLISLGRVSTLRVLRREFGVPGGTGDSGLPARFSIIGAMILLKAHDFGLGALVFGGFCRGHGACRVGDVVAAALLSGLRNSGVSWRFGVANLRRPGH